MIDDVIKSFKEKSRKTIEAFSSKLATFRTGRANPALVENLMVESSDLGLTPQTEDDVIRVIVPSLTGERREEYKRLVKQEAEKSRVTIRSHRKNAMDEIKFLKDEKEISEDEEKRAKNKLQEEVGNQTQEIDRLLEKKLEELEQI